MANKTKFKKYTSFFFFLWFVDRMIFAGTFFFVQRRLTVCECCTCERFIFCCLAWFEVLLLSAYFILCSTRFFKLHVIDSKCACAWTSWWDFLMRNSSNGDVCLRFWRTENYKCLNITFWCEDIIERVSHNCVRNVCAIKNKWNEILYIYCMDRRMKWCSFY